MGDSEQIHFGTSGWRAIIADTFTFSNVRLVSQAIADYLKEQNPSPKIIIGFDTRFLSSEFAQASAKILSANKIKVLLTDRDTPTPVISYHLVKKKFDGAINFTASHNPAEYNGIKFSPAYGGPAQESVTCAIEKKIRQRQLHPAVIKQAPENNNLIRTFNPRPDYLKQMRKIVNIAKIKKAGLKIAIDCMYGTSRRYIDTILNHASGHTIVLNDYLNPLFGGFPPEPDKEYIGNLIGLVKTKNFHLGLACDGDADRFGIVDKGGIFLNPNEVFTLLFAYLLKTRGKLKKVARTLATTHMIDAIATVHGVEIIETPVGFKYIGEALSKGDCLIGGEESGGLSIAGHVPEKDGILACLLIAEMMATEKKPLIDILKSLYKKYGYFYSHRLNISLNSSNKDKLLMRLDRVCKHNVFGNLKIKEKNVCDGYKFIFDKDYWIMFRPSGTEPVVRSYLEAPTKNKLRYLEKIAKNILST